MVHWVRVPAKAPRRRGAPREAAPVAADWTSVLYFGPDAPASIERAQIAVTQAPPPRRGDTRARQRS